MPAIYIQSSNIISSLGLSTRANIDAVIAERSGSRYYGEHTLNVAEAFYASLIDDEEINARFAGISDIDCSRLEKTAILSVTDAIKEMDIDIADSRTLFVFSTTKGNVEALETGLHDEKPYLWHSAKVITRFFNHANEPVVVSNACISGVSAVIIAKRMLESGMYDTAVVIGADVISRFVVSGFQSFKALSVEACRPFDSDRVGLNLGESAATVILKAAKNKHEIAAGNIIVEKGAITNDANHISGPSRTGEGLFLAIQSVMQGLHPEDIGFINAHGTATPYNDEMEATAITRAALNQIPVFSLKGYFGHTLGAAGLLELIISAEALKKNTLIKNIAYNANGVSHPLRISVKTEEKKMNRCLKLVSGFGGCNAVCLLKKVE